jgi:ER lumen protein retaining receptor
MKLIFITSSAAIVYMMTLQEPYKNTYDSNADNFNILYIAVPVAILALILNDYKQQHYVIEYIWTISILLESVAIIPQLFMVHNYAKQTNGFVENLTSHYVFTLGGYRAMYLLNWIYRYLTEDNYLAWVVWLAGIVQTAIYGDFFYYYIKAQTKGERMSLPI